MSALSQFLANLWHGEVAEFLTTVAVAEGVGAKLSRLLHGFLEGEVLSQTAQAVDLGWTRPR